MFDKVLDRLSTEIALKIIEMTAVKVEAGLSGRGAAILANAVAGAAPKARVGRPPGSKNAAKPAAKAPKFKRDMNCRVAGCKNRSKGPGFRYMCEEHMKLPKSEQIKAGEAYKAKHAAKA
jgi:hypothetical protein